jgi:hypothetical protein
MQIASALARGIGELLDDRKYGISYDFRLAPETVLVEHMGFSSGGDLQRRCLRDDAKSSL